MSGKIKKIPVDVIELDGEWAEWPELTASMAEVGLLQPIVVCLDRESVSYHTGGGRKRVVSARKLGWKKIDALVFENEAEMQLKLARIALAENLHGPNWLSDARAIETIDDPDQVRRLSGIDKGAAAARMNLLKLHPEFQQLLEQKTISLSTAKELAKLPQEMQHKAYTEAKRARGDDKSPSAAQVKMQVRRLMGELQPQIPVPVLAQPAQSRQSGKPDPIVVAMLLRVYAKANGLSCDQVDILERAADIIEEKI